MKLPQASARRRSGRHAGVPQPVPPLPGHARPYPSSPAQDATTLLDRRALNMYSRQVKAFYDESEQVGLLFASHAASAKSGAQREQQLRVAISGRDLVGQAMGVLMERHKLTADQAFAVLTGSAARPTRSYVTSPNDWSAPGKDPRFIRPQPRSRPSSAGNSRRYLADPHPSLGSVKTANDRVVPSGRLEGNRSCRGTSRMGLAAGVMAIAGPSKLFMRLKARPQFPLPGPCNLTKRVAEFLPRPAVKKLAVNLHE